MKSMNKLNEKNLLVLTTWFPPSRELAYTSSFIYDSVLNISKCFNKVYVISLIPKIPSILRRKPWLRKILGLNNRWHAQLDSKEFGKDYKEGNLYVFYIGTFPLSSKGLGIKPIDWVIPKICKTIDKLEKIDIVHSHFLYPSGYIGMQLKKKFNIPLVVTGHGSNVIPLLCRNRKSINRKMILVLNHADAILTVGKGLRDVLINEYNISKSKVFIVPNPLNPEKFYRMGKIEARKELNISPDKKLLLSVGSLSEFKGFSYLIKGGELLYKHFKDFKIVIIGSGPKYRELNRLIRRLKLENVVHILPTMSQEELRVWFNAADLFILPSLTEGLGMVQLEAMACGTPVVATKNGGSETIITDDKVGILVEPGDSESLYKGILEALNKSWDEEYIVAHSKKFSPENFIKKSTEIYLRLIH